MILIGNCFDLLAQTYVSKTYDSPLTEELVRQFLKMQIKDHQLQKDIQNRKDNYSRLEGDEIKVFYKELDVLLKNNQWIPEEYNETKYRVYAAKAAIEQNEHFQKELNQHQKDDAENKYDKDVLEMQTVLQDMLEQIKNNEVLSEEQKQKSISAVEKMQNNLQNGGQKLKEATQTSDAVQADYLSESKADWPAVKPFVEKIDEITQWYNGARSDPPAID